MLVAAALIPDTALLVPGSGGGSDVVAGLREAALAAVAQVIAVTPDVVVVVAPGASDGMLGGTVSTSLAAAGIPDHLVAWPGSEIVLDDDGDGQPSVAAAVALHLIRRAGWRGRLRVVEVTSAADRESLVDLGVELATVRSAAFVVVGSGSGRHGPDAPLADDDRAPAFDAALVAALADGGPGARARLAASDPGLAQSLAVRGWAPWQVLVGAVGDTAVEPQLLRDEVVQGAQHAVLVWTVVGPDADRR